MNGAASRGTASARRRPTNEGTMEREYVDSRAVSSRGASPDAREGVSAFLEKRPARFPDRVSADLPDFFPPWPDRPFTPLCRPGTTP